LRLSSPVHLFLPVSLYSIPVHRVLHSFLHDALPICGGKTLTSLAFALDHAVNHGLRRVILVIPFTSIVEQNAAVFRAALGHLGRSEEHTSELQSRENLVCRLLLDKKKQKKKLPRSQE